MSSFRAGIPSLVLGVVVSVAGCAASESQSARSPGPTCFENPECKRVCELARTEPLYQAECELRMDEADRSRIRTTRIVPQNDGGNIFLSPSAQAAQKRLQEEKAKARAEAEAQKAEQGKKKAANGAPAKLSNYAWDTPRGVPDVAKVVIRSVVSIETPSGFGTGFSIDSSGWIATNLHVIGGESKIKMTDANGSVLKVLYVGGFNRKRDIAILRVKGPSVPELPIAAYKYTPDVGTSVVAVGHPMGLEATVSTGIVSQVRRLTKKTNVIQISAPISPGSSGGPIVSHYGQVVGISTFLVKGGNSLGFGIPAGYLWSLARSPKAISLKKFARYTRDLKPAKKKKRVLPKVSHGSDVLQGCSGAEREVAKTMLTAALGSAQKQVDAEEHGAAYHGLIGASSDLGAKLGESCALRGVLETGRQQAGKQSTPAKRAAYAEAVFRSLAALLSKK